MTLRPVLSVIWGSKLTLQTVQIQLQSRMFLAFIYRSK